MKKLDLKEEISKHYKWALENPTILTVSALQEEWIRWVEDEILPNWEADLHRLKTGRMTVTDMKLTMAKILDRIEAIEPHPVKERILTIIRLELESKSEMR